MACHRRLTRRPVLNDPIQLIGPVSLVGNSRETFHKSGTDGSNPGPSSGESVSPVDNGAARERWSPNIRSRGPVHGASLAHPARDRRHAAVFPLAAQPSASGGLHGSPQGESHTHQRRSTRAGRSRGSLVRRGRSPGCHWRCARGGSPATGIRTWPPAAFARASTLRALPERHALRDAGTGEHGPPDGGGFHSVSV